MTLRLAALLLVLVGTGCEFLPKSALSQLQVAQPLPHTGGTYLNMGRHFLSQGQLELAHDAFIRSLRVEGLSASALTGAGVAMEKLGLLTEARRYFERAVRLAPSSVVAYNNLGAVQYRIGAYHEAKQAFQAAYALSSGTSQVAERNLRLSERAIEVEENQGLVLAPNPVPLQRTGTGEYILGAPANGEADG